MIYLFAVIGHILYAKRSLLYLQMMLELIILGCTNALENRVFMEFAEVGGGFTATVRPQWIYTMHKCAGVHDTMTAFTNTNNKTSEQHVDLRACVGTIETSKT